MTKFQQEDTGTQLVDLNETQNKLENQLADGQKGASGPKSGDAFASAFVTEMIMSAIAPAPVAAAIGIATMVAADILDSRKKKGSKKEFKSSFFVPKSANDSVAPQQRSTGISMMPSKPADLRMIAKMTGKPVPDIGALKISEMSLRGTSLTGGASKPFAGLTVSHRAGRVLETSGNSEIRASLNLVHKAKHGPMSLSRIENGLNQGYESAEQAVKQLGVSNAEQSRIKQKSVLSA